jgi:hypothetical protein
MTNITLAIPEDLHERMKQHSDIRWSAVIRKTIKEKIDTLELLDELTKNSKLTRKDVQEIAKKVNGEVARKLGLK